MRQPPKGYASCNSWAAFNAWADTHQVPAEQEDWEYLWECFLAGYREGIADQDPDAFEEVI